jgi:DNA-binding FadR family transcriptional regulator
MVCYQTNDEQDQALVKSFRAIGCRRLGWSPMTTTSSAIDLTGVLRPVRQGNAFEETVERLLTVIKLGLVGHGERFPAERELAAQLGISRLTLRDAIHELNEAGYVCSRRGRFGGTFVTYNRPSPSSADLRRLARQDAEKLTDALTFRLAVEAGAAEALAVQFGSAASEGAAVGRDAHADARSADAEGVVARSAEAAGVAARDSDADGVAARNGDADGVAARDDDADVVAARTAARDTLLARLADVTAAGPADYRRMDTLFHLCIAELTGSSLLAAAAADARMRLNDLLNAIPVLPRNISHAARQHVAIVESILSGDGDRARRAVAEHLEGTAALLRGFLA